MIIRVEGGIHGTVTLAAATNKRPITLIQSVEYLQTQNLPESGDEGRKKLSK